MISQKSLIKANFIAVFALSLFVLAEQAPSLDPILLIPAAGSTQQSVADLFYIDSPGTITFAKDRNGKENAALNLITGSLSLKDRSILPTGTAERTYALWFKSSNAAFHLMGTGRCQDDQQWGIWFDTGTISFRYGNQYSPVICPRISVPNRADDNKWHHAAITLTVSGFISLYMDGVIGATTTCYASISNEFFILSRHCGGSATWDGLLADVRVYNRALSSTEIENLFILTFPLSVVPSPSPAIGVTRYTLYCPNGFTGPTVSVTLNSNDNSWTWGNEIHCSPIPTATSTPSASASSSSAISFSAKPTYTSSNTGIPSNSATSSASATSSFSSTSTATSSSSSTSTATSSSSSTSTATSSSSSTSTATSSSSSTSTTSSTSTATGSATSTITKQIVSSLPYKWVSYFFTFHGNSPAALMSDSNFVCTVRIAFATIAVVPINSVRLVGIKSDTGESYPILTSQVDGVCHARILFNKDSIISFPIRQLQSVSSLSVEISIDVSKTTLSIIDPESVIRSTIKTAFEKNFTLIDNLFLPVTLAACTAQGIPSTLCPNPPSLVIMASTNINNIPDYRSETVSDSSFIMGIIIGSVVAVVSIGLILMFLILIVRCFNKSKSSSIKTSKVSPDVMVSDL